MFLVVYDTLARATFTGRSLPRRGRTASREWEVRLECVGMEGGVSMLEPLTQPLRTVITVEASARSSPHSICVMRPAVNPSICSSNTERTVTIMVLSKDSPDQGALYLVLMEDEIIH